MGSKAGDFDFTEVLIFPENDGPEELRSSSEAGDRAFRTKLEAMNQSLNEAISESVEAKRRNLEDRVWYWLDGIHAGPRGSSNVHLPEDHVDTCQQLAQVLQLLSLEEDPDKYLLHLSRAIVTFLPELL